MLVSVKHFHPNPPIYSTGLFSIITRKHQTIMIRLQLKIHIHINSMLILMFEARQRIHEKI